MKTLILFIVEVLLCLGISLLFITLLRTLLLSILIEICGTETRARFWLMFTQLMMTISPLLIVVFLFPTSGPEMDDMVKALKDTLFRTLFGDFIALAAIGRVMWKSRRIDGGQHNRAAGPVAGTLQSE